MQIIYLIIARTFGGLKGFSMKRAGQEARGGSNSLIINLLRSVLCLAISVIIWAISGFGTTTELGNLLVILSGISNAMTVYFWVLAAQMVSISLIEVFSMLGTVVLPLFLAPVLYNGDSVNLFQWIGTAVLLASVIMFSDDEKKSNAEYSLISKIITVLMQVIGVSGTAITQKLYTYHISDKGLGTIEYFNFATFVVVCLAFVLIYAIKLLSAHIRIKRGEENVEIVGKGFPLRRVWIYVLLAAVGLYAYQYFATLASTLPSAILYPLSHGLSMVVCFVLDTFIFAKKLTLKRVIAFVAVIAAIILVNL